MAKILIVKDNATIPDNINNDVLATYPAAANIYSAEDFVNLIEFDELESALNSKDPELISTAKINLARKVCVKEQALVLDGVFDVIEINDKSLNEIQDSISAVIPEQKQVWVDPSTGENKELIKLPSRPVRYEDGEFKDNISVLPENSLKTNEVVK